MTTLELFKEYADYQDLTDERKAKLPEFLDVLERLFPDLGEFAKYGEFLLGVFLFAGDGTGLLDYPGTYELDEDKELTDKFLLVIHESLHYYQLGPDHNLYFESVNYPCQAEYDFYPIDRLRGLIPKDLLPDQHYLTRKFECLLEELDAYAVELACASRITHPEYANYDQYLRFLLANFTAVNDLRDNFPDKYAILMADEGAVNFIEKMKEYYHSNKDVLASLAEPAGAEIIRRIEEMDV